jgi:hypothetical protein
MSHLYTSFWLQMFGSAQHRKCSVIQFKLNRCPLMAGGLQSAVSHADRGQRGNWAFLRAQDLLLTHLCASPHRQQCHLPAATYLCRLSNHPPIAEDQAVFQRDKYSVPPHSNPSQLCDLRQDTREQRGQYVSCSARHTSCESSEQHLAAFEVLNLRTS